MPLTVEERKERAREQRLVSQYGLTSEDYDRIVAYQGGTCALETCDKTVADKRGGRLAVDHDHRTGITRGALCSYHNRLITRGIENNAVAVAHYLLDPPAPKALGRVVQGRTGGIKKRRTRRKAKR